MSLILNGGTVPRISAKSYPLGFATFLELSGLFSSEIFVRISPKDMAALVEYWLTNTNLEATAEGCDPREALVERIKKMKLATGYDNEGIRFVHGPEK